MTEGQWRPAVPRWAAVVSAAALALIALPFLALAARADWSNLASAAASPEAISALSLSVRTALAATALSLLLGLPLALVLARWRSKWSAVLRVLVLLPLVAPPLVGGMALLSLFGRNGPVGALLSQLGISVPFTTLAVVLAQAFVAMPFLVVSAEGALRGCDPRYERTAAQLGAGPGRVALTITIPLIAPGVLSGTLLCFARALGEFGATALFAGNVPGVTRTMPLAIYTAFNASAGTASTAIVLSLELLAVAAVILLASGMWRTGSSKSAARGQAASEPDAGSEDPGSSDHSSEIRTASLTADVRVVRSGFTLDAAVTVAPGEVVGIVGPNGSGKSTLLDVIAGTVAATDGWVRLGGQELTGGRSAVPLARRRIGLLSQDPALFPHLSGVRNVAYPLRARGVARREAERVARGYLSDMGCLSFAGARPGALSGGQRQRVALARVLASEPDALALDESFGALDADARPDVRAEVAAWLERTGTPCLVVTHDLFDVTALADRLVVLADGRIEDDGPTERVLFRPRSRFAASLAGLNLVAGHVREGRFEAPSGWSFDLPEALGSSGQDPDGSTYEALAAVPFTAIRLCELGSGATALVEQVQGSDGGARVRLYGPATLIADVSAAQAIQLGLAPGRPVGIAVADDRVTVYPAGVTGRVVVDTTDVV